MKSSGPKMIPINGAFQIEDCAVSLAAWQSIAAWAVNHLYKFTHAGSGWGANHPVHTVDWYDACKWCNARSEMEGLAPVYMVGGMIYRQGNFACTVNAAANGYRLPTVKEWEIAALGGGPGPFPNGKQIYNARSLKGQGNYTSPVQAMPGDGGPFPFAPTGTVPVDALVPNAFGLHSMSGNVYEFCFGTDKQFVPAKGGSWHAFSNRCQIPRTDKLSRNTAGNQVGLRCARNV